MESSDRILSHAISKVLSFTSCSKTLLRTICLNLIKHSMRLFILLSFIVEEFEIPNFENIVDI